MQIVPSLVFATTFTFDCIRQAAKCNIKPRWRVSGFHDYPMSRRVWCCSTERTTEPPNSRTNPVQVRYNSVTIKQDVTKVKSIRWINSTFYRRTVNVFGILISYIFTSCTGGKILTEASAAGFGHSEICQIVQETGLKFWFSRGSHKLDIL